MKKTKYFIMLAGDRRSGKDFFAEQLINANKQSYYDSPLILHFARLIKKYASDFTTYSIDELDELKNKEESIIIRFEYVKKAWQKKLKEIKNKKPSFCKFSDDEFEQVFNNYNFEQVLQGEKLADNNNLDIRVFLQLMGESFKIILNNPDIWADLLIEYIGKKSNDGIIIPDFRFKEEYNAAKKWADKRGYNLITAKIQGKEREKNIKYDNHISENDLSNYCFDFVIDNTNYDDQTHLFKQAVSLLEFAKKEK